MKEKDHFPSSEPKRHMCWCDFISDFKHSQFIKEKKGEVATQYTDSNRKMTRYVTTDRTPPPARPPYLIKQVKTTLCQHLLLSLDLLKISCDWEPRSVWAVTQSSSGLWQARGGDDGVGGGDDGVAVTSRAYLLLPAATSVWWGRLMRTH